MRLQQLKLLALERRQQRRREMQELTLSVLSNPDLLRLMAFDSRQILRGIGQLDKRCKAAVFSSWVGDHSRQLHARRQIRTCPRCQRHLLLSITTTGARKRRDAMKARMCPMLKEDCDRLHRRAAGSRVRAPSWAAVGDRQGAGRSVRSPDGADGGVVSQDVWDAIFHTPPCFTPVVFAEPKGT